MQTHVMQSFVCVCVCIHTFRKHLKIERLHAERSNHYQDRWAVIKIKKRCTCVYFPVDKTVCLCVCERGSTVDQTCVFVLELTDV